MAGRPAQRARRARSRPRSQHCLRGPRLAAAIVDDACVSPGDLVVEIGAGGGRLTEPLAARGGQVVAIELDPLWAGRLRARFATRPNVTVVEGDALAVPLPAVPFRVVANVPFHLTTAILHRLLDDPGVPLVRADLIVEWEVARKRSLPWPSTLLTVIWGARYELGVARRVPAACFEPKPAADAGVLRIVRRTRPLVADRDVGRFHALVAAGFRARATRLRSALADSVPPRRFKGLAHELGFAPSAYARDLDVHQWVALFGAVRPLR